jgi:hypothetical protein
LSVIEVAFINKNIINKQELRIKYEREHFVSADTKKGKLKQDYAIWLEEKYLEAITVTRCCKSDGEQFKTDKEKDAFDKGYRKGWGVADKQLKILKMNVIEKTRNDIKAYVRSLNTPENTVYQENELIILSCFSKAQEILEENEKLALIIPKGTLCDEIFCENEATHIAYTEHRFNCEKHRHSECTPT